MANPEKIETAKLSEIATALWIVEGKENMERDIEEDLIVIECAIKNQIERHNIFTVSVLQRCHKLVTELKEYRDLKERLNSIYGECDGLLEVVVEHLERHEGSVLTEPVFKARLLTAGEADRWEEWKSLEEQGKLLKLPCAVGDTVYAIFDGEVFNWTVRGILFRDGKIFAQDGNGSVLGEFGKTVFLTREEVESHGMERRGKMRVYLSGAITGTNDFMERFNAVEDRLTSEGMSVVNPAKINSNLPKDFIYAEYMEIDFLMIDLCDAIYMMDGWQKSRGATREYWYASGKEKIILFEGQRENHGEGNT